VYASSSSVYGGNTKGPFSEDDRVDQLVSLYAATKKADELMRQTYAHLSQSTRSKGSSLFGVLRSSASELSAAPASDVFRGALLLFGIGSWSSQYGISRIRYANPTRVLIAMMRPAQEPRARPV